MMTRPIRAGAGGVDGRRRPLRRASLRRRVGSARRNQAPPRRRFEGSTENTKPWSPGCWRLRERGLTWTRPVWWSSTGPRRWRSIKAVFDQPVVQRCQTAQDPQRRAHLPTPWHPRWPEDARRPPDPDRSAAEASLDALARSLDKGHPGAAGSLLRASARPSRSTARRAAHPGPALRSTNAIESMIEICRDHSTNVKRLARRNHGARWVRHRHARSSQAFRRVTATYTCRPYAPPSTLTSPEPSHPSATLKGRRLTSADTAEVPRNSGHLAPASRRLGFDAPAGERPRAAAVGEQRTPSVWTAGCLSAARYLYLRNWMNRRWPSGGRWCAGRRGGGTPSWRQSATKRSCRSPVGGDGCGVGRVGVVGRAARWRWPARRSRRPG